MPVAFLRLSQPFATPFVVCKSFRRLAESFSVPQKLPSSYDNTVAAAQNRTAATKDKSNQLRLQKSVHLRLQLGQVFTKNIT